jgi:tRNA (guanine37-N1)-methyltransferase
LLCGRYEGLDERIRQHLVADEIRWRLRPDRRGFARLVLIDAVTRLLPGVLGDPDGAWDDSHASGLLEYPHYTRPVEFRGWQVPEVLLSGDHARLARWRREQALLRTWQRRPELLASARLSKEDLEFLSKLDDDDQLNT